MNGIQDHFNGSGPDYSLWAYYNMNSPCYNPPERYGDSMLKLVEYDGFNEGNCLLSRRYTGLHASVSAVLAGVEKEGVGGACVGFYAGNGAYTDYVLLCADSKSLQIRVPSGAQKGASFMDAGQPQQSVLAECAYSIHFPMELTLRRDGDRYTAYLDGRECLRAETKLIQGDARAMIKAHYGDDRYGARYALFDSAAVEGFVPTSTLRGQVRDSEGRAIVGASVHIAGYDNFYTLSDDAGAYELRDVPRGENVVVAAAEGYSFARTRAECIGGVVSRADIALAEETQSTLPRREYNNPSFDRSENGWACLNGSWQFSFDPDNVGETQQWYLPGAAVFDKVIRVPFSWASLMGFGEEHLVCGDANHEANTAMNNFNITGRYGWYRRTITIPQNFPADRHTVLHIGAATSVTNVWLDGRYLGMHVDEYADLAFDLGVLQPGSRHLLVVKTEYAHNISAHNMGKQIFWFSSAPGIWQSVWIESASDCAIESLHVRPELEFGAQSQIARAEFALDVKAANSEGTILRVDVCSPGGEPCFSHEYPIASGRVSARIPIAKPELWQYKQGRLYQFRCQLLRDGAVMDVVRTWGGLRKVETRWLKGHSPEETPDVSQQYKYLYLNDRPFYLIGILDQGFNAFGIYTYRSLNAEGEQGKRGSIAYEIDRTLAYGYNLSRMHIKENEPLWYHECDRQGLLVWTEHPSNFFALPENPEWQAAYNRELDGMLERLYNHPSIVIVSSINESWGIEGAHCSTPWKNELRYQFLRRSAERVKELNPQVLVCDNSGFGKTEACEINDFHFYPSDYFEAHRQWEDLVERCYPGSIYNFINEKHTGVDVGYGPKFRPANEDQNNIGHAVQTGQPVYVSEFLHINAIDLQLRMFEKIAGYLRMNVASHEVENSGPMTADRFERDYGYVDADMQPLGYDMVNNMDHVVADLNRITRVRAGERLSIDVYTSHFSWNTFRNPVLHWSLTGVGALGEYLPRMACGASEIRFEPFCVEKQPNLELDVPQGIRGAYLFLWVQDGGEKVCQNYVQLVVDDGECALHGAVCELPPLSYTELKCGREHGCFFRGRASLLWMAGAGSVSYLWKSDHRVKAAKLVFEAGSRQGIGAVKVTDEIRYPSQLDICVGGVRVASLELADDPSDERALFTNAALGGEPFSYANLGKYGYGEKFEVDIPPELTRADAVEITFRCGSGGMTLYGEYAGRYGFHPSILWE